MAAWFLAPLIAGGIGFLGGLIIGGGSSIVYQLCTTGHVDWGQVGATALQVGTTLGTWGLTLGVGKAVPVLWSLVGRSLAIRLGLGGLLGLGSNEVGLVVRSKATGVPLTKRDVIWAAGLGTVFGMLGMPAPGMLAPTALLPSLVRGTILGGAGNGAIQTVEEAANGWKPGAARRIGGAVASGAVAGAGGTTFNAAVTRVIAPRPAPVPKAPAPAIAPAAKTPEPDGFVQALEDPRPRGNPGASAPPPESSNANVPPPPARKADLSIKDRPFGDDEPPITAEQILGQEQRRISTRVFLSKTIDGWSQKTLDEQQALVDQWDRAASHGPTVSGSLANNAAPILKLSPTLANDLKQAEAMGWSFRYGTKGEGSMADATTKTVVIDPIKATDPVNLARTLAHEVGHVLDGSEARVSNVWRPGMTRDEYVNENTAETLKSEGKAVLTNVDVQREILQNGGPRIGLNTAHDETYLRIANDPSLTFDQKVDAIARMFDQGERQGNPDGKLYGDAWRAFFGDVWDHWMAKQAQHH